MNHVAVIVIDVQNDFVTGELGTPEAQKIVPRIKQKIDNICYYMDNTGYKLTNYHIVYTRDTHDLYENTVEADTFPEHCIEDTSGWCIVDEINNERRFWYNSYVEVIDKDRFSVNWGDILGCPEEILIMGLTTDICVISNALWLRSLYPRVPIKVYASCCAGTTPEKHKAALEVMKSCCIDVVEDEL